jgi:hypothetical protein
VLFVSWLFFTTLTYEKEDDGPRVQATQGKS